MSRSVHSSLAQRWGPLGAVAGGAGQIGGSEPWTLRRGRSGGEASTKRDGRVGSAQASQKGDRAGTGTSSPFADYAPRTTVLWLERESRPR